MAKYLSYIQLRAARSVLNLGIRDIAEFLTVGKSTINKVELGKTRDFLHKHSAALTDFFTKNNIVFPTEYSIKYTIPPTHQENKSITRFQLKAARVVLNTSQLSFSQIINTSKSLISRAELLPNETYIKSINPQTILRIKDVFLQHGIELHEPNSIFFKKKVDTGFSGW